VSTVTTAETTTSVPATTTTIDPLSVIMVEPPLEEGSLAELEGHGIVALGRISVMFTDGATPDQIDAVTAALDGHVIGILGLINLYEFSIPEQSPEASEAAVAVANEMPGVEEAFIDHAVFPGSSACTSTSPFATPQYEGDDSGQNYEAIGVPEAWDIIEMSGIELNKVRVGVVDRAIEDDNGELAGSPITQDFSDTTVNTDDEASQREKASKGINHGTAVTNVISANPDNGGVVGVASVLRDKLTVATDDIYVEPDWVAATDAASPATTMWGEGAFTNTTLVKVLKQVKAGATVINMSFGPKELLPSNRWTAAAYRKFFTKVHELYPAVVFVAAAGNETGALNGTNSYPGGLGLPNVITVGAIDKTGAKASFTNTEAEGSSGEVTLAAPGVAIPVGVSEVTGTTRVMSGTSFSAPMVTGAIALIKAINPELSAAEIKDILVRTAYAGVPAASGDTSNLIPESLGGGVLRVDEAVLAVINDVRAKANPPLAPLTREGLLALTKFDVDEQPTGPGDFTVTASVGEVRDEAVLSLELFDEGGVTGNSHVTLAAPGSAEWGVTLADPASPGSAKVCRVEAKRCCVIELKSLNIPGTYEGLMVIEEVVATDDIVVDLGDAGSQVVTKEQCEEMTSDMIGQFFPLVVTLSGEPGAISGEVTGTITDSDGETKAFEPTLWNYNGGRVSFTVTVPGEDGAPPGTFAVSGVVKEDPLDESGLTIEGPWSLQGFPELTFGGTMVLAKRGAG